MIPARVVALAFLTPLAWAQDAPVDPGLTGSAWSPYLAGALIGGLTMLTFYFSNKPIGASGAYAKLAGLIGKQIAPRHIDRLPYFDEKTTRIDWEVMLVAGAVLGALFAAWTGGEITARWLPPMWGERFGTSIGLRLVIGFAGGLIMAFGARLAGGCTSGHGISGTLQLSVGSWIAVICFFVGGMVTAMLIYGGQPA